MHHENPTEFVTQTANPESATPSLVAMDRRLAELGRGVGALRLRMGEALEVFAARGGVAAFGFSSLGAYAAERLGRSGRWAADARSLARRLARLPALRRALVAGELGASMVELLARHAVASSETELIAEARGTSVRAMRVRLAEVDPPVVGVERATVVAMVDRSGGGVGVRASADVDRGGG